MCRVRSRRYQGCNHFVHEVEHPCEEFLHELDKSWAKGQAPPKHFWCALPGHKASIEYCNYDHTSPHKFVNLGTVRKERKPPLVHIKDIKGSSAFRKEYPRIDQKPHIVGGHCANPQWLPVNGRGGGPEYRDPAMGHCGWCEQELKKKGQKGWFAIWK